MELRDYVHVLRAHWITIVVLTILGAGAAWGWSITQPRVYTATTTGIVSAPGTQGDLGSRLVGDQLAQSVVKSYIEIGSWRSVAEYAIDDLNLATTPESLVHRVDVTNPNGTVVIRVSADGPTPAAARDLAESWLRGMISEIEQLEGNETSAAVTVAPGDSARLPVTPSSPDTRLALALGALIGLAIGVGYAALRHLLDLRVRDPRDVEEQSGVAVNGSLPHVKALTSDRKVLTFSGGTDAASPLAEATRELRTNLSFIDIDNPPRAIVVTSPLPGDGKSTVAANLARSLAAAGEQVILIDGDLRRPTVASLFNLTEGAGLTDVLTGRATVDEVAQIADASRNLRVIGAGRIPPNPSEVLAAKKTRDSPRRVRRHDSLEGSVSWDVPASTPASFVSARSAWSPRCGPTIRVSTPR